MRLTRRSFLAGTVASTGRAAPAARGPLAGEVGVTTGSFMRHLSPVRAEGKLVLTDLPRIMRDELGMKVLDLMTATLASTEPRYLDELRAAAGAHGCVITNLKMNNPGLDLGAADEAARQRALAEYKRTLDVAARLGARWARPLPGRARPDLAVIARGYRELAAHARPLGIGLLVENYGWMQDDPEAIPRLIAAVGEGVRAQPDTRNWTDAARYEGLARAFPLAVSCDFKPAGFDADWNHRGFDLRRCFQTGHDAGFRGPWCLEHFAPTLKQQLREMIRIRDDLKRWMREAGP